MILKVELELDDLWTNEEGSLSKELVSSIKSAVVYELRNKYEADIKSLISSEIINEIKNHCKDSIENEFSKFFKEGKIDRYGKQVTVSECIEQYFSDSECNRYFNKFMNEFTEMFCKEKKKEYDRVFANKMVRNLGNLGLLKDELLDCLLK
ncbi:MAG: hypothetical protein ACRCZB_03010 [Bacteroidales bacterium]